MAFCVDCGFELEESACFCGNCGRSTGGPNIVFQQDMTCPVCGSGLRVVQTSPSACELRCDRVEPPLREPNETKDFRAPTCLAIGIVMMAGGIGGDLAVSSDYDSIPLMIVAGAGLVTFAIGLIKLMTSGSGRR